jgi:hypothetical protein
MHRTDAVHRQSRSKVVDLLPKVALADPIATLTVMISSVPAN